MSGVSDRGAALSGADSRGPIRVGELPDGRAVHRYTLGEAPGLVLQVLDLGASVHRLEVSGRDGVRRNVVLGNPSVGDRLASPSYFGATIGRYANRIAGGRFRLDGREVTLRTHDRGNSLHGGPVGFDLAVWEVIAAEPDRLALTLHSRDGDMGFPGALTAQVEYRVGADYVSVAMSATADATTVANLTNHAYFNLNGEGTGSADDHSLTVHADQYTPVDRTGIPLGDHADVTGTPFDLRRPTRLGPAIRTAHAQLAAAHGIDHNYVIAGAGLREAAILASPTSGIRLELSTDQPGLQVYTGNHFNGTEPAGWGGFHRQGDGVALEPQLFPDTPNHPEWPSARLEPGQTYRSELRWRFRAP
ncbi:MAG: aldose epimerase family protein [Candidatus Nanopelagicales bacterium]